MYLTADQTGILEITMKGSPDPGNKVIIHSGKAEAGSYRQEEGKKKSGFGSDDLFHKNVFYFFSVVCFFDKYMPKQMPIA
jgi:hypothetical protein